MATSPEVVRTQLAVVTTAAAADLAGMLADVDPADRLQLLGDALTLVVPPYYEAAGTLAVTWYDERRSEASPESAYTPNVVGDPVTDWIEREAAKFRAEIERDAEQQIQELLDETTRLAEKEVARGFRDSITGNVRMDSDGIGWSRVARVGACKLCVMLADRGAVFSEATAIFAAHTDCRCAARPEFRNGEHGPEASVQQYLASTKRRTSAQRERLREYLNENYPDAPG